MAPPAINTQDVTPRSVSATEDEAASAAGSSKKPSKAKTEGSMKSDAESAGSPGDSSPGSAPKKKKKATLK